MKLTPLDIRKQVFDTALRGYEKEDVDAFLQMVSEQWEELVDERRRLEDKVEDLEDKMAHYQRVEEALQEALQTARENAEQTLENARQEAELLIQRAETRAEDLKREAERKRDRFREETDQLSEQRGKIIARLRAFLMSEMELLVRYAGDDPSRFIQMLPPEQRREIAETEPEEVLDSLEAPLGEGSEEVSSMFDERTDIGGAASATSVEDASVGENEQGSATGIEEEPRAAEEEPTLGEPDVEEPDLEEEAAAQMEAETLTEEQPLEEEQFEEEQPPVDARAFEEASLQEDLEEASTEPPQSEEQPEAVEGNLAENEEPVGEGAAGEEGEPAGEEEVSDELADELASFTEAFSDLEETETEDTAVEAPGEEESEAFLDEASQEEIFGEEGIFDEEEVFSEDVSSGEDEGEEEMRLETRDETEASVDEPSSETEWSIDSIFSSSSDDEESAFSGGREALTGQPESAKPSSDASEEGEGDSIGEGEDVTATAEEIEKIRRILNDMD